MFRPIYSRCASRTRAKVPSISNVNNLPLETGDIVAVEASPGHDIGIVSLTGDMVAKPDEAHRASIRYNGEFKKIYRKAKPYDIETLAGGHCARTRRR